MFRDALEVDSTAARLRVRRSAAPDAYIPLPGEIARSIQGARESPARRHAPVHPATPVLLQPSSPTHSSSYTALIMILCARSTEASLQPLSEAARAALVHFGS
ncbi:unnamed protein product [Danaus chrysippus]|uniref:(African queen) hypothetical protein n=1 Tax=Danaus chrysippus TaxID=151541 RepID=A0A8J2QUM3_9NEOP|nr:unnamed protein product [Danaus chrysippus]